MAHAGTGTANGAVIAEEVWRRRDRSAFRGGAVVVCLWALSNHPRAFIVSVALAARPTRRAILALDVWGARCRTALLLAAFSG